MMLQATGLVDQATENQTLSTGQEKTDFDGLLHKGSVLAMPRQVRSVLPLFLQAHEYASAMKRDPWDFALEIAHLRAAGLTVNDLRFLLYGGVVEHAREVTARGGECRAFRLCRKLAFSRRSCFILTDIGVEAAREAKSTNSLEPARDDLSVQQSDARSVILPAWDPDRRALKFGGRLVKHFRLPSPNQEMVLGAFDEEGWPTRIDDPLPPVSALNPKRRLHDTIKSLNRHQKNRSIRFMGDGRGEGVLWEPCISTSANGDDHEG